MTVSPFLQVVFQSVLIQFSFQACYLWSIPFLFTSQHPFRCPAVIVNVVTIEKNVMPRDREHAACNRTHLKVKCLDVKTRTNLRDLTLK